MKNEYSVKCSFCASFLVLALILGGSGNVR